MGFGLYDTMCSICCPNTTYLLGKRSSNLLCRCLMIADVQKLKLWSMLKSCLQVVYHRLDICHPQTNQIALRMLLAQSLALLKLDSSEPRWLASRREEGNGLCWVSDGRGNFLVPIIHLQVLKFVVHILAPTWTIKKVQTTEHIKIHLEAWWVLKTLGM